MVEYKRIEVDAEKVKEYIEYILGKEIPALIGYVVIAFDGGPTPYLAADAGRQRVIAALAYCLHALTAHALQVPDNEYLEIIKKLN